MPVEDFARSEEHKNTSVWNVYTVILRAQKWVSIWLEKLKMEMWFIANQKYFSLKVFNILWTFWMHGMQLVLEGGGVVGILLGKWEFGAYVMLGWGYFEGRNFPLRLKV